MKIADWKRYTLLGSAISIKLVISLLMLPIDHIEKAIGQVEEATISILYYSAGPWQMLECKNEKILISK